MSERGRIIFKERAQQINDFSGLQYENITPTDIDGLIEYHDKAYVIFEVKYDDKEVPWGQKLAIQRLIDDTAIAGKNSIALIIDHYVHDTGQSVNVADCYVREYYWWKDKQWLPPKHKLTVKQCIDGFLLHK